MGRMWRICARKRCSRWITRSMTSLNDEGDGAASVIGCPAAAASVVGAGGAEGAGSCESAGNDDSNIKQRDSEPTWSVRIKTLGRSLCQLENNMQDDGGIGWLAILERRLESYLLGG